MAKYFLWSLCFLVFCYSISYKNGTKQAEKEMANMANVEAETSLSKRITFKDIAGNEEAKESLKELVDFIKELKNTPNMELECLGCFTLWPS